MTEHQRKPFRIDRSRQAFEPTPRQGGHQGGPANLRGRAGSAVDRAPPVRAARLVRKIAEHAYKAGAGIVTPIPVGRGN